MDTLRIIFLSASILISGCTTAKLHMKIDPELEKNSYIYEVKSAGLDSREIEDISFGHYWVEDTSQISTYLSSDIPTVKIPWLNMIFNKYHSETLYSSVNAGHSYKFKIGNNVIGNHKLDNKEIWDAHCYLVTEKSEYKFKKIDITDKFSILYSCEYRNYKNETWYLSIEQNDVRDLNITMSNNKRSFQAHVTNGEYVWSEGSKLKSTPAYETGFTWTDGENDVAAVSVDLVKPKVWLWKKNIDSDNNILSMASAGLLLFKSKIAL